MQKATIRFAAFITKNKISKILIISSLIIYDIFHPISIHTFNLNGHTEKYLADKKPDILPLELVETDSELKRQ